MERMSFKLKERYSANTLDYILVFMLIALTGFEFFFQAISLIFFFIAPLSIYLFVKRQRRFSNNVTYFILFIVLWDCGQLLTGNTALSALITFNSRILVYIIAISAINDFPKVFLRLMYWICCIALVMYIITQVQGIRSFFINHFSFIKPLGGGISEDISTNPGQSLILYFIPTGAGPNAIRNSGPFWEPGMFAVFINIALFISIIKDRAISKESKIFILSSVSTLSTSSLICTFLILLYYYITINKSARSIFYLSLLFIGFMIFLNSDIGASKINADMDNDKAYSRFGAILYHWSIVEKYPLTGIGMDSFKKIISATAPNGLLVIFSFWGIPAAIGYLFLLYRGCKRICLMVINKTGLKYSLFLFLVMLIIAFSQDVTTRHFYYIIALLSLVPIDTLKKEMAYSNI